MNIILLAPGDWLDESTVCLDDRRHEHIRGVLKAEVGDALRVGLLGGLRGSGIVIKLSDERTYLQIDLVDPPLPRHPCDLILALPRPKMLRRAFRTAAEMGVAHLYLINSARVEKSYWQSPLLQPDRIDAALTAGLERAGDTVLPQVHQHPRFKPFVEDQLPELIGSSGCWIAHPSAPEALATQSREGLIMLGPEGGFVPYEVELAQSMGAHPVRLSDRILSVDTAVTAALSQSALSS
jgi:16S rRNA (uracil1498-N3)-methyltransferase